MSRNACLAAEILSYFLDAENAILYREGVCFPRIIGSGSEPLTPLHNTNATVELSP